MVARWRRPVAGGGMMMLAQQGPLAGARGVMSRIGGGALESAAGVESLLV